jgi:hypothetical protein
MIKQKLLIMNIRRINGISELFSNQSLVECLFELTVNISELPTFIYNINVYL